MLNDREKILTALREKPLKIYEVMKRANLSQRGGLPVVADENAGRRRGQVRHSQGPMADRLIDGAARAQHRRRLRAGTVTVHSIMNCGV